MARLPHASELFGGDPTLCDGIPTPNSPHGRLKPGKVAQRHEQLVKAMTASTAEALRGDVITIPTETGTPLIRSRRSYQRELNQASQGALGKSLVDPATVRLGEFLDGPSATTLAKEWTTQFPISTGLVPYDLEAGAKLLFPRATPLRNQIPRVRGQGSARRYKVISGISNAGTTEPTLQGGFSENTLSVGPGGLSYIRPPYVQYSGYDVTQNYVSYGLSDSVSWQAEFEGVGFEDIRSLSATSLLYATLLLEERLFLYGRGTTANNYTGPLGTPSNVTVSAVSASVTPNGTSSLGSDATVWILVAADAGDLLSVNGTQMHQGPTTATAASVTTSAGLTAVQVIVGTDVPGALGYNVYAASVQGGPYYYAGRSGFNVIYVTSQPSSGPTTTAGAGDQSAVSTNFDGIFTNLAASATYVRRLNAPLSTTSPGVEYQTSFANLYESTKADPQEIILNGFDRMQLSSAILNGNTGAYRVFINDQTGMGNVTVGAVVQTLMNQVTGSEVAVVVNPWCPQGNSIVRSKTIPIPDSNISETFMWAGPQDYSMVQWPPQQFTWDSSTIVIGTLCSYAPTYSALIQGIQGTGISNLPGDYTDS